MDMIPVNDDLQDHPAVRPAADTALNTELARRLTILGDETLEADCTASNTPILKNLALWALAAGAGWVAMLLVGN
jgi:hypothetical protein